MQQKILEKGVQFDETFRKERKVRWNIPERVDGTMVHSQKEWTVRRNIPKILDKWTVRRFILKRFDSLMVHSRWCISKRWTVRWYIPKIFDVALEHSQNVKWYGGTFPKKVDGTEELPQKYGRYDGTFQKDWTVCELSTTESHDTPYTMDTPLKFCCD